MKKHITILIALLLMGSFIGCGGSDSTNNEESDTPQESQPETLTVHRVHIPAYTYELLENFDINYVNTQAGDGVNDDMPYLDFATKEEADSYIDENKPSSSSNNSSNNEPVAECQDGKTKTVKVYFDCGGSQIELGYDTYECQNGKWIKTDSYRVPGYGCL